VQRLTSQDAAKSLDGAFVVEIDIRNPKTLAKFQISSEILLSTPKPFVFIIPKCIERNLQFGEATGMRLVMSCGGENGLLHLDFGTLLACLNLHDPVR